MLRCDAGIATYTHDTHGATTAMHGRRRRRRPAGSGAMQGGHLQYPELREPRAAEAPGAWQRGRRALQQRRAATGARPGPTAVLQSAASPARRRVFRLDASLVGHAVCRSAAGSRKHCPWAAMAPTAASHQHCGSAARPRSRPRRGRGAEPPAAATPVVVVGPRRLRRTPSLTGHKVGRSKRASKTKKQNKMTSRCADMAKLAIHFTGQMHIDARKKCSLRQSAQRSFCFLSAHFGH